MTKEVHDLGCCIFGRKIYLAGDGSTFIEEYDPYNDSFTMTGIKTNGSGHYTSMCTVGDRIMIFCNKELGSIDVANETMDKIDDLPPEGDWRCPFVPIVESGSIYILHGGRVLYQYDMNSSTLNKLVNNFT